MPGRNDLAASIRSLVGQEAELTSRTDRMLTEAKPMPPMAQRSGQASPLRSEKGVTEIDYLARKYHSKPLKTTDGLFSFPAIKQITATDENGDRFTLNFAEPKPNPTPTTP